MPGPLTIQFNALVGSVCRKRYQSGSLSTWGLFGRLLDDECSGFQGYGYRWSVYVGVENRPISNYPIPLYQPMIHSEPYFDTSMVGVPYLDEWVCRDFVTGSSNIYLRRNQYKRRPVIGCRQCGLINHSQLGPL